MITVIPQIENAIISSQAITFLGERGQAKSTPALSSRFRRGTDRGTPDSAGRAGTLQYLPVFLTLAPLEILGVEDDASKVLSSKRNNHRYFRPYLEILTTINIHRLTTHILGFV